MPTVVVRAPVRKPDASTTPSLRTLTSVLNACPPKLSDSPVTATAR